MSEDSSEASLAEHDAKVQEEQEAVVQLCSKGLLQRLQPVIKVKKVFPEVSLEVLKIKLSGYGH